MRFMMIVIPKDYEKAAADRRPDAEAVAAMQIYNQSLQQAGILLAMDGLHPPATASRVSFANGKPTVTDGPFTEAKESIGGYWVIQVRSKEEAVEWASRCPMMNDEIIEIRRIFEMEDFPADVQEAAAGHTELKAQLDKK